MARLLVATVAVLAAAAGVGARRKGAPELCVTRSNACREGFHEVTVGQAQEGVIWVCSKVRLRAVVYL